jgi:type IV fimbrial biogenesis protein FimT
MNKQSQGFTLVELMVVIGIIAIALAIAVPSYNQFVLNNRMTIQANEFIEMISLTQNYARTRKARATLCKSSDNATCTTAGSWEQGHIVFLDGGTAGSVDGTDTLMIAKQALTGKSTLVSTTIPNFISFSPVGQASLGGSFKVCSRSTQIRGRTISVAAGTGRISVAEATCP